METLSHGLDWQQRPSGNISLTQTKPNKDIWENSAKELDQWGQKLTRTKKERTRTKCQQKNARCVYPNPQRQWNSAYQSIRTLPSNVEQRKTIHHGVSRGWRQLYRCRTNEEQIRGINNKSLPSTVDPTHCIRHSQTNNTHPWQQSIGSVQSGNQKELRNPISPAGQSSTKSGRMSGTNLWKPLQSSDGGGGQQFPYEPMGQTPPPNDTPDPQPAPTIEHCSHGISIPIRQRTI